MFNKIKNLVSKNDNKTTDAVQILNLDIEGMTCGHCSGAVTKMIENLPGVSNVEISHENNNGKLNITDAISSEVILEIINEGGKYHASIAK